MKKTAFIACAVLLQLAGAAKAETVVTTYPTFDGGWQTVISSGWYRTPTLQQIEPAPPNACDRAQTPGFEIASGKDAGACVNSARRPR